MPEKGEPMAQIWVADTEPNERFTLYTRGNTGEVFPHVMTALTVPRCSSSYLPRRPVSVIPVSVIVVSVSHCYQAASR